MAERMEESRSWRSFGPFVFLIIRRYKRWVIIFETASGASDRGHSYYICTCRFPLVIITGAYRAGDGLGECTIGIRHRREFWVLRGWPAGLGWDHDVFRRLFAWAWPLDWIERAGVDSDLIHPV